MFGRSFSARGKSHIVNRSVQIESLEGRRLLSAASIDSDVLGLDSGADTHDFTPLSFVTESVKLLKIEGTFLGHIQSAHYGKGTISFNITHATHTGHFTGTAEVTANGTTVPLEASGKITASKHVSISVSDGSKESGEFSGTASHTGGSFYGSYSVTGTIKDTGTYHRR